MIRRLFRSKKRLDSPDPAERRAAIAALTDEDARAASATLATVAREDQDEQVRHAALGRLMEAGHLAPFLEDEALAAPAARRLAELADRGQADELANHPAVLLARLERDPAPDLLETLLAQADDQTLVEAAILLPRAQKERLLALPRFRQAANLQALERRSRDRDKVTNRLARERLDILRAHRAQAGALSAEIDEHLILLEKPTAQTSPADARKRQILLATLDRNLAAIEEPAAALAEAGEPIAGLQALRSRRQALPTEPVATTAVPGESKPAAADDATDRPAAAAAAATTDPVSAGELARFDDLADRFLELEAALAGPAPFQELAARRQALTETWLARSDHAPPNDAEHQIFERVSHRFQALAEAHERFAAGRLPEVPDLTLPGVVNADTPAEVWSEANRLRKAADQARRLLAEVRWPEWSTPPQALTDLKAAAGRAEGQLAAWQTTVNATVDRVEALLARLNAHIDAGELKEARSGAAEIRRLLKVLPAQLGKRFNAAMSRASAHLGELSDWQTFATTPKREKLVEAMRSLVDAPLPPKDQAARIKALRGQWNELGPVGRSEDHRLLEQFNEAAEAAFEPCRSYFAEQAEVRARNLQAREEICESLASYLAATDWAQADYKAAEQIMRTARQEWRRFHPIDRTPGKAVEARFEALQAELHEHIKAEWDRNLSLKQAIVTEAQALADAELDTRQRTDQAKALQRRWQVVGPTPRRPDQTLWRQFRAACDDIFAARDDAKKRADDQFQANRSAYEQLLEEFRQALDEQGTDLTARAVRDLQSRFEDLPALPERVQRAFGREFDQLVRSARLLQSERRSAEERARLATLKTMDAEVSELEQQQLAGETIRFEPPDPLFDGRCAAGAEPLPSEALTRLVIEAEIAAGLESPETNQRMAIQVELMNSGRSRQALEAAPEELTARWCRAGPKDADAAPLRERFFTAIEKLASH